MRTSLVCKIVLDTHNPYQSFPEDIAEQVKTLLSMNNATLLLNEGNPQEKMRSSFWATAFYEVQHNAD